MSVMAELDAVAEGAARDIDGGYCSAHTPYGCVLCAVGGHDLTRERVYAAAVVAAEAQLTREMVDKGAGHVVAERVVELVLGEDQA